MGNCCVKVDVVDSSGVVVNEIDLASCTILDGSGNVILCTSAPAVETAVSEPADGGSTAGSGVSDSTTVAATGEEPQSDSIPTTESTADAGGSVAADATGNATGESDAAATTESAVSEITDRAFLGITIQPAPYTLTRFSIRNIAVAPDDMASITIEIEADNGLVLTRTAHLAGESYKAWGTDDSYLWEYIRKNIRDIV